jgi:hypothetical protein
MIAAEPRNEPADWTASKSSGTSIWSGVKTGTDEPPGMIAFRPRPSTTPWPCSKLSSRRVVPSGSS